MSDDALMVFLLICGLALLLIPVFFCLLYAEVKKIRKEMENIKNSIFQMNSNVLHQISKIIVMNKHLAIIGSKLSPGNYRRKDSNKN